MKNKQYLGIFGIIILVLSLSCQTKKPKETPSVVKEEPVSFFKELSGLGWSGYTFSKNIKLCQQPFQQYLVNDPNKFRDYKKDLNISAANIGIYLSDAQYLRAYDKIDEAYVSSRSAQRLFRLIETNELDTSLRHMQKGYRTQDSALFYLNDALKDSVNGLSNVERKQYLLSLFYGSFIERNYIMLSLLKEQSDYKNPNALLLLSFIKEHNDILAIMLKLRKSYHNTNINYQNYLFLDLRKYNDYFIENKQLFDEESNGFRQKEFVVNLLEQVYQMRNYIIYDGLLIKEDVD